MQNIQQRSPGNFNNPFQNMHNLPPYQMADLNSSDRVGGNLLSLSYIYLLDSPGIAGTGNTNGHTTLGNRSEDAGLNLQSSMFDASTSLPNNVADVDIPVNDNTSLEIPANNNPTDSQIVIPEHEVIGTAIKNIILNVIKWNILNMITFILVIVTMKCHVSYLCVLVFLWLYNTYNIIAVSQSASNRRYEI